MGRKIINYEGLGLIVLAAAIIVVSNIAIIETTQIASAHTLRVMPLAMRACTIFETYPVTADCSTTMGSTSLKAV
jgi:hypothetical protein